MSELPPPVDLAYQTPDTGGSAAALVRLAAVLNLVMGCLEIVYGLFLIGSGIYEFIQLGGMAGAGAPLAALTWFLLAITLARALLSFAAGAVKIIGGTKLRRIGRHTWGWGLAAGIVGCTQLWCGVFCIFTLAVGIYTIVILCQRHVQGYLDRVLDGNAPRGAFEVTPAEGGPPT